MKDLNLIPKNYFIEKKNKIKKAYLSILILCIGVAAATVYIAPTIYEYKLENEKETLVKQIADTSGYLSQVNEFNSLKQAVETRENEGTLLSKKKLDMLGIINAIEFASPDKLFIQSYDAAGEDEADVTISLKGAAENEETIASFIRNLLDDMYFKEVGISGISNKQGNNGSTFEIKLVGVNNDKLTKYNGWDNSFSIGYMPSWVISQEKDDRIVFAENASLTLAKPATLEILMETTDLTSEGFSKERQSKLEKTLKNYKLEYSSNTKNSKVDAMKTMYYAQEDNIEYQFLELCVVKDYKCYIVTYKSDSTSFSNTAKHIDRILKSFSIN